jgi:hypothetical protein
MSDITWDRHFLNHPEVRAIFDSVEDLLAESDRGAILLCAEYVSDQLRDLFDNVAPAVFAKKDRNRLLEFPGVLSSFSARHTVAGMCGLISPHLHEAIHHLRKLRNMAAHQRVKFALWDHWDQVRVISDSAEE